MKARNRQGLSWKQCIRPSPLALSYDFFHFLFWVLSPILGFWEKHLSVLVDRAIWEYGRMALNLLPVQLMPWQTDHSKSILGGAGVVMLAVSHPIKKVLRQ